jgi:phosphomannomutase
VVKPLSLKISLTGVRGIAGETLTPRLVASFAAAFGTYCGRGPVVIGTDTRPSREMVTQAAIAGLLSVGCTPVDLGVVPLPSLQFYLNRTRGAGGICISASHNPMEWNALKFFGADGIMLRPNQFAELADLYHQGVYPRVKTHEIQQVRADHSASAHHRAGVLSAVDVEAIRARKFKAAVDCCNGAASNAAPEFLRALGCEVINVNTDPNAPFPRNPEPLAENLGALCRAVRESGADVGFAQDADADRLALVSERGEPLGEDCTVALAVDHVLSRVRGPVVVNMSTSRLIDDIAARYAVPVHRTKVGEIHVLERMLACSAAIGGEGNGGVILPSLNPCRDSFIAMALVLESLTRTGETVSALRSRWPYYAIVKQTIPCRSRDVAPFLRLVRHLYRDDKQELTDGVLIRWPDRWLHVRGSQTEPVLRIIGEARTEPEARAMIQPVLEYLRPGIV